MSSPSDDTTRPPDPEQEARLRADVTALLEHDAAHTPESVMARLRDQITFERGPGREIALPGSALDRALSVTEGALRTAIRTRVDKIDAALLGRSRLRGDLGDPGASVIAEVSVSVRWRAVLPDVVGQVRDAVTTLLREQTGREIGAVDVRVVAVHVLGGDDD